MEKNFFCEFCDKFTSKFERKSDNLKLCAKCKDENILSELELNGYFYLNKNPNIYLDWLDLTLEAKKRILEEYSEEYFQKLNNNV